MFVIFYFCSPFASERGVRKPSWIREALSHLEKQGVGEKTLLLVLASSEGLGAGHVPLRWGQRGCGRALGVLRTSLRRLCPLVNEDRTLTQPSGDRRALRLGAWLQGSAQVPPAGPIQASSQQNNNGVCCLGVQGVGGHGLPPRLGGEGQQQ